MNNIKYVFNKLKENNLTISFCESVTCGLLVSSLVKYKGASKIIKGALITYSKETKTNLCNIKKDVLLNYGAVSKETVIEMYKGLKEKINSDIYISITGNVGPSYDTGVKKLVSFLLIGTKKDYNIIKLEYNFKSRSRNLNYIVKKTYKLLKEKLDEKMP